MKIWIHRDEDFLRDFLQPDLDIKYIETDELSSGEVLLIKRDERNNIMYSGGTVVLWDETLEKIKKLAYSRVSCNYDYYALDYQLNREDDFDTLVVGSSYPQFGLDMTLVPTWRNLALGSQDIYYSYHLAQKMYKKHKYKRLFWGAHYYTLYSDLSRAKNQSELANITYIYSRIFPHSLGLHNAWDIPKRVEEKVINGIFDIEKSIPIFIKDFFDSLGGFYWNKYRTRFSCRMRMWQGDDITWLEANEAEKRQAAKQRTESHNKSIRYTQSLKENIELFTEMGKWCQRNGIEFYILNFPVSKLYRETENPAFRETYYDIIKSFDFPAVLFDFEEIEFGDEYFNDMDHLNDKGAKRLTEILLNAVNG